MATDRDSHAVDALVRDVRSIHASDPSRAEELVEAYLELRLRKHDLPRRLEILEEMAERLGSPGTPVPAGGGAPAGEDLLRLLSVLLGRRISPAELSSEEVVGKLARSLNTLFDSLNEIVGVIDRTLLGKSSGDETIRMIIGSGIEGEEGGTISLNDYLDRIRRAFLVAHAAFRQAASEKVGEVLDELDPERIASSSEGGFRFGPLRKAEHFDLYREKFRRCREYESSGRLAVDMMKSFERICRKTYETEAKRTR